MDVLLQRARQALACSLLLEGCLGPKHGEADAFPVLRAEAPWEEPFALVCRACLDRQLGEGLWALGDEGEARRRLKAHLQAQAALPPQGFGASSGGPTGAKARPRRAASGPGPSVRKPPR